MSINRKNLYYDTDSGFEFITKPIEDSVIIRETNNGYIVKYLSIDEDSDDFLWEDIKEDDTIILLCYSDRYLYLDKPQIITKKELILYFEDENNKDFDEIEKIREIKNYLDSEFYVFPLYAYIHSGIVLSMKKFSDRWDSGMCGAVLVRKSEYSNREQAYKASQSYIDYVNDILMGEIYKIIIQIHDKNKKIIDYDIIGGYVGEESAMSELKNMD